MDNLLEPPKQQDYQEIKLIDYIRVIIKRKNLILILFVLTLIGAGIFSFLQPKRYKIDATIGMGTIGGSVVQETGQLIAETQAGIYEPQLKERLGNMELEFPELELRNPERTNLIKIKILSANPLEDKKFAGEFIRLIFENQEVKIKIKKASLEKNIEFIKKDIEIINLDIGRIKNKIVALEKEKSNLEIREKSLEQILPYQKIGEQLTGTLFSLLDVKGKLAGKELEINDYYLQKNSLERQIHSSSNQITTLEEQINNIDSPAIIKPITTSKTPVKPQFLLNMAIAGILGLFIGVFLAFSKEWWERNKI